MPFGWMLDTQSLKICRISCVSGNCYKSREHQSKTRDLFSSVLNVIFAFTSLLQVGILTLCGFGRRLIENGFCSYYLFVILANKIQSSGFSLTGQVHGAARLMIYLDNFW